MKKLDDFKIMPIFSSQPVSDPQIFSDGTKILFTYSKINLEEDKYDSHIWMMDTSGKKPLQFTQGKCEDSYARWSPDEETILFLSNRISQSDKAKEEKKKKNQIWVIPRGGGEAEQLTSIDEGVQKPLWSPDGKRILFLSNVFKGEKAKDSDVKIIRRLKYKYNGRGFFEGKYTHLFIIPAEGGKPKDLTEGEYDVEAFDWSSDGTHVFFVSNLGKDAETSFFRNIYRVPVKGGEPELIFTGKGPIGVIKCSPDGSKLTFTGSTIDDPNAIQFKNMALWVIASGGGEVKNLTATLDRTIGDECLIWAHDSENVYFKADDLGSTHIYRASLSGEVEQVTEGKLTVGSFSMGNEEKVMALTVSDATSPFELWVKDVNGLRTLTDLNKGLVKKLRLSEPEEFWFTASDGVKVQGWIVKPFEFEKRKKYPLIIQIHGGPHSAYGFKMTAAEHEFQVLSDNGFVVVYTNPRASTGYGEAFARITGHWGERDYQDILEAVDYAVKTYGYIDGKRLGVAGGSYGGYMTNWIVGHTNRFSAAVTMRSISNWYSFHGSSDIGWMSLPTHELGDGKDPWDNLQLIMEKSPITYVKNVKTPLLILHSEEDYRCPMEQAEQMFAALKKLGKTVELVRFPGENHELSRSGKPKHRIERLQHIVRWFNTYLGAA
jgi:dipeptidyl aminopeptidase/acylaminoacyl peptidase